MLRQLGGSIKLLPGVVYTAILLRGVAGARQTSIRKAKPEKLLKAPGGIMQQIEDAEPAPKDQQQEQRDLDGHRIIAFAVLPFDGRTGLGRLDGAAAAAGFSFADGGGGGNLAQVIFEAVSNTTASLPSPVAESKLSLITLTASNCFSPYNDFATFTA